MVWLKNIKEELLTTTLIYNPHSLKHRVHSSVSLYREKSQEICEEEKSKKKKRLLQLILSDKCTTMETSLSEEAICFSHFQDDVTLSQSVSITAT